MKTFLLSHTASALPLLEAQIMMWMESFGLSKVREAIDLFLLDSHYSF